MDLTPAAAAGSGNSGGYCSEIAETLRFEEEIQSLMRPDNAAAASSFIALLGLPPNQALELLDCPPDAGGLYRQQQQQQGRLVLAGSKLQLQPQLDASFRCSPTFPSNAGLVARAARFSVFAAAEDSPETSAVFPSNSETRSPRVKPEPADSDSSHLADKPPPAPPQGRQSKRKEPEKPKAKSGGKKGKSGGCAEGSAAEDGEDEKLPYVHVRARRGQATDSHSLAERARREKINARMKLLQELVPGCSKISGTALVLDEIINHVQALQRQVEFLSMRLAAVNPRIDFSGLDNFLAAENGRLTGAIGAATVGMDASSWPEVHVDGVRRQERQQQQIWQVDLLPSHQSSSVWDRDDHNQQHHHGFTSSGPSSSLFGYDPANPVPMHVNQLKTEL